MLPWLWGQPMSDVARQYIGHDEYTHLEGHPGEGTDLLLTIWDDESGRQRHTLAMRPGLNQRWRTWGPPASLTLDRWEGPTS